MSKSLLPLTPRCRRGSFTTYRPIKARPTRHTMSADEPMAVVAPSLESGPVTTAAHVPEVEGQSSSDDDTPLAKGQANGSKRPQAAGSSDLSSEDEKPLVRHIPLSHRKPRWCGSWLTSSEQETPCQQWQRSTGKAVQLEGQGRTCVGTCRFLLDGTTARRGKRNTQLMPTLATTRPKATTSF